MVTKLIISAHSSQIPAVKPGYHFMAHSKPSRLSPQYFSTQTRSDGSVILREYANQLEWSGHRKRVSLKLSHLHSIDGPKTKCHCDYCLTANMQ